MTVTFHSMDTESSEPQIYFGELAVNDFYTGKKGREALELEFNVQLGSDITILFAYYNYENYSGRAYVLFTQLGQSGQFGPEGQASQSGQSVTLYEVVASHCSCYGLDGQWVPSPVTPKEARLTLSGSFNYYLDGDRKAQAAALAALDRYEAAQSQPQPQQEQKQKQERGDA